MRKSKKVISAILALVMCAGMQQFVCAEPAVTTIPGTDRTEKNIDSSFLSTTGFAKGKVNDRSNIKEGDPEYAVVNNVYEYFEALTGAEDGTIKVIEVRCDLNLGWYEVGEEVREEFEGMLEPYEASQTLTSTPVGNPVLIETGVSTLTINGVDGLTIFSKTGNTVRHVETKFNGECNDVIVRNLKFEDMWEWDDWRTSGFGTTGGKGNSKRTGWTNIKINGANNVWIDHCSFGVSFDGNVDIENGSAGISITWCEFGMNDIGIGTEIYETTQYLEEIYQRSKNADDPYAGSSFLIYGIMRDNGITMEQIAKSMVYHKKCHLVGSGDKDTWLVPVKDASGNYQYNPDGTLVTKADTTKVNANERLRLTLAYNNYTNMGSRIPMIRSGVAHLFNCYLNGTGVYEAAEWYYADQPCGKNIKDQVEAVGGGLYNMTRASDGRNGASVGADTNVYENMSSPLLGSESQLTDGNNNAGYEKYWHYNYNLVVNSAVKKSPSSAFYNGSSWDNNGKNDFTGEYGWSDKSTIGNWSWGQEGEKLSYSYQTFPLETVKNNVLTYSGAYKLDLDSSEWLQTDYASSDAIKLRKADENVAIESISFQKETARVLMNEYLQLIDNVLPTNHTDNIADFVWKSSDPKVAKVLDSGLVVPLSPGKTTVSVTTKNGKKAECEVTVSDVVSSIDMSEVPDTLYVGDTVTLKAKALPGSLLDDTVNWYAIGKKLTCLDADKGIFRVEGEGTATVVAAANQIGCRVGSFAKEGSKKINLLLKPAKKVLSEVTAPTADALEITEFTSAAAVDFLNKNFGLVSAKADGNDVKLDITWKAEDYSSAPGYVNRFSWKLAEEVFHTYDAADAVSGGTIEIKNPEKEPEKSPVVKLGDVDRNGKVDLTDANTVLKAALGIITLNENDKIIADADKNQKTDLADANLVLKAALGIIVLK